jgi:hypothetical protein
MQDIAKTQNPRWFLDPAHKIYQKKFQIAVWLCETPAEKKRELPMHKN